jgi:predicted NACHT family NTPase
MHHFGGHTAGINAIALAPDGRTLATGSWDTTVRLWDRHTRRELRSLAGHGAGVRCLAFSPDGKRLASGGSGAIVLWDPRSAKVLKRITTGDNDGFGLAFSPDGRTLAAGNGDGSVRLWDSTSGARRADLKGHAKGPVYTVAFSPDGKLLASGALDSTVCLWDPATGKLLRRLTGHGGWVLGVAFSPGGEVLASAGSHDDPTVRLWEVATGREVGRLAGHKAGLTGLAFSPDGRALASASWDRTVRVWEVLTRRERCSFLGPERPVGVAFSLDGRVVASGGADTTALLWDVTGGAAGSRRGLEALWADLARPDAGVASRAMWALASAPRAVPFLRARLRPVVPADRARTARLLAELDDDYFKVREKAERELAGLGEGAESALREALKGKPGLEVRSRIERLLDRLDPAKSPERLRALRAVEALEHAGTPEALKLLARLAEGAPEARLTREARASCQRLKARR